MVLVAHITLGLVAGGQARRLGGHPKGVLEVHGRPVVAWLLDLAEGFSGVLLGANDPAPYAAFGLDAVADVTPGKGAPGGVVSLLLAAKTPWVLCVACDMPFVRRAHVEALRARAGDDVDVVVAARLRPDGERGAERPGPGAPPAPRASGEGAPSMEPLLARRRRRRGSRLCPGEGAPSMEPLLGLYRASLGAAWHPRLAADPSLRALVASARWTAVTLEASALDGLNTPA
ncbi:MAG: molybdenum cofactor guanylyltransferase, partial [Myxococcaceae bacterium]|nr:molybdenum cofactor guanylyltransferase [Myxococcaceae bacterium]